MDAVLQDCRAGFTSLRSAKWTALVAILTIALGTGINTAVVAVAYGVLLRPLPYADPSRLAIVTAADGTDFDVRLDRVGDWQSRIRTLGPLAAYSSGEFTMRGAGEPRTVRAAVVTAQFFDVLGVAPLAGRVFTSDTATDAVVSRRLARQIASTGDRSAANPAAAVSQSISIGQGTYTIAAVMPDAFAFPSNEIDVWVPARSVATVRMYTNADLRTFRLIGRLASGASVPQARDDARRVHAEIDPQDLTRPNPRPASIRPIDESVSGGARPVLQAFAAAAMLVLLVACANVATLLMGRSVSRERELAIRLAIGADSTRLVRAALAEALILAVVGSLAGVVLAAGLVRFFVQSAAGVMPRLADVTLDLPVLLATIV